MDYAKYTRAKLAAPQSFQSFFLSSATKLVAVASNLLNRNEIGIGTCSPHNVNIFLHHTESVCRLFTITETNLIIQKEQM